MVGETGVKRPKDYNFMTDVRAIFSLQAFILWTI